MVEEGIGVGQSHPLGSTVTSNGVNFSLYSKSSTACDLLLFDHPDAAQPARTIPLDPRIHRTFHYWHIFVEGITTGQVYGYRLHGPFSPPDGHRFDPNKLLIDPYGKAICMRNYSRAAASHTGDNTAAAVRSVVADTSAYDWEGDTPLRHPYTHTVIYEMHVGGFTRNPNSGVTPEKRGTYLGLIEKIPYLQDLGVTTVELLPIFQFDPYEAPRGKQNYWGYNPISFFAPHCGYAQCEHPLDVLDEFRDMVKALHQAGIEVILDVVYNHTAEGNQLGPTFCFKGIENTTYYILEQNSAAHYANYSGTGNTLNANHAIVRRLILDSLRYWVEEMHVDGFRFDLASILSRDENGIPLANPPILWDIESDPVLAGTKLIAEAWDAAGLYQVGSFVGDHWKEWNGAFRDDVRDFIRGTPGSVNRLPTRFLASPDLYGHNDREPEQSINFVTCHDGFTLNDLVSYNEKNNWANGEQNRDGHNHNMSWNHGVEGPTTDPLIERVRERQIKNFFVITLMALGTPMIGMGDEVRRTQQGNNNAYCQDNEISWFDWDLVDRNQELFAFVKHLIAFRLNLALFEEERSINLNEMLSNADIQWHGTRLNRPDWGPDSHSVSFTVRTLLSRHMYHMILNAYWEPLEFELPVVSNNGGGWRRVLDTYLRPPYDLCSLQDAPLIKTSYVAQPRSIVMLVDDVI